MPHNFFFGTNNRLTNNKTDEKLNTTNKNPNTNMNLLIENDYKYSVDDDDDKKQFITPEKKLIYESNHHIIIYDIWSDIQVIQCSSNYLVFNINTEPIWWVDKYRYDYYQILNEIQYGNRIFCPNIRLKPRKYFFFLNMDIFKCLKWTQASHKKKVIHQASGVSKIIKMKKKSESHSSVSFQC